MDCKNKIKAEERRGEKIDKEIGFFSPQGFLDIID